MSNNGYKWYKEVSGMNLYELRREQAALACEIAHVRRVLGGLEQFYFWQAPQKFDLIQDADRLRVQMEHINQSIENRIEMITS